MGKILALTALALFAVGALFITVLACRRLYLAREERRRRTLEPELRPIAFALIDGERVDVTDLDERESQVLAAMLGRYSHQLTGASRRNIATFFERNGHVFRELSHTKDRTTWRRATAAYTLGDMGSRAAVPALLSCLNDRALDVRGAAARSLGKLGSPEAVEPLVRALVSGAVPRAVAAQALLAIGPAALPDLRQLVADEDEGARARAVELVGLLGHASDGVLLLGRVQDPAAEVRAKACRALGRLGADDAATGLQEALHDRITFVRATAAIGLGMIGDAAAADDLVAQARDDRFSAAQSAARALARIDPTRVLVEAAVPGAGPHLVEESDLLALRAR